MTGRERMIDLMIEAKRTDPETGSFTDYLADYLLEHGVIVLPCKDAKRSNAIVYYLTREEAEKVLNGEFIEVDSE